MASRIAPKTSSVRLVRLGFEAVVLVEEDTVGVVAVDAIEWGERAGFHDDAVEGRGGAGGDEAFRRGGVIDGVNGRDARSTVW